MPENNTKRKVTVNMKPIDLLSRAWAAADRIAETLTWRLSPTWGLIIIPRRHETRTANGSTLAKLLKARGRFPAIVICAADEIDAQRQAIRKRLPHAHIAVIDWCHPATPTPADITLITPQGLRRQHGALIDYRAAVIAVIAGKTPWEQRQLRALNTLMQSARGTLLVVEEWAYPEILAAAVGRVARVTPSIAKQAVTTWREDRLRCGGIHTARSGDMAVSVLACFSARTATT
jgi:hypothetical protein